MKKIVFTFGRFNPPTIGHKLLADKVKKQAKKLGAESRVYASPSFDKKKNPLSFEQKLKVMRKVLRGTNLATDSSIRNPFHALKQLSDQGYTDVTMVVGSDRVAEFKRLISRYIGKDFNFDKFQVVSAGERDPDAEGVSGMSASKMRAAAESGNFSAFRVGLPSTVSERDAKNIFSTVQKGMGVKPFIKESWFDYDEFVEFAEQYEEENVEEGRRMYKAKVQRFKERDSLSRQHAIEKYRLMATHQRRRMKAREADIRAGDNALESVESNENELNEITMQARRKMARAAKRTAKKRARVRAIKQKRRKTRGEIEKKSRKAARNFFKKKIIKSMKWEKVPIKQRENIEKILDKKKTAINKLSKRMIPKMQKAEQERLKRLKSKMTSNNPQKAQESFDDQFERMLNEEPIRKAMKKDREMNRGTGASNPKEKDAARKRAERDTAGKKKDAVDRSWEKSSNPWDHVIIVKDDRDDSYKLEMADDLSVEHHELIAGPSVSPDTKSKGKVTLSKVTNLINRGEPFTETKTSKRLLDHMDDMKSELDKVSGGEEQPEQQQQPASPEEQQAAAEQEQMEMEQQAQEEFEKEYFVGKEGARIPRSLDPKTLTKLRKEGLGQQRDFDQIELPQARVPIPKDEGKQLEYAFTYVALQRSGLSEEDIEARLQHTPELTAFNEDSLGRAKAMIKAMGESGFDPSQIAGCAYSGELGISGIKGGEPKTDNVILLEKDDPMNDWAFTKGMLGVSMKKDGDIQASSAQGPRASSDMKMGVQDSIQNGEMSNKLSKSLSKLLEDVSNMPSKIIAPRNVDKALSSPQNYTDKKQVGNPEYLKPAVRDLFVNGDPTQGIRDEVNGEIWTQKLGKQISKKIEEEFKANPEMASRVLFEQLSGQSTFSQEGTDSRAAADVMVTPYGMKRITLDYCQKLIETGAISVRVSQKGSGGGLGRMTLRVDVKGEASGSPAIKNVAQFLTGVGINECVNTMRRFVTESMDETGVADTDLVRNDLQDHVGDIASSLFMKNYDVSLEGDLFKPFEEEHDSGESNTVTIGKKTFNIPVMKMADDITYKKKNYSDDTPETPADRNRMTEGRNYRKEYENYQGTPKQRANRSKRVLARRRLMNLGRVKKGDGKDVDHKNGNPKDNSDGNLRVRSVHANRSDNKQSVRKEEHGAGEQGTSKLLRKYMKDTPYAKLYNLDNAKDKK